MFCLLVSVIIHANFGGIRCCTSSNSYKHCEIPHLPPQCQQIITLLTAGTVLPHVTQIGNPVVLNR